MQLITKMRKKTNTWVVSRQRREARNGGIVALANRPSQPVGLDPPQTAFFAALSAQQAESGLSGTCLV